MSSARGKRGGSRATGPPREQGVKEGAEWGLPPSVSHSCRDGLALGEGCPAEGDPPPPLCNWRCISAKPSASSTGVHRGPFPKALLRGPCREHAQAHTEQRASWADTPGPAPDGNAERAEPALHTPSSSSPPPQYLQPLSSLQPSEALLSSARYSRWRAAWGEVKGGPAGEPEG